MHNRIDFRKKTKTVDKTYLQTLLTCSASLQRLVT